MLCVCARACVCVCVCVCVCEREREREKERERERERKRGQEKAIDTSTEGLRSRVMIHAEWFTLMKQSQVTELLTWRSCHTV